MESNINNILFNPNYSEYIILYSGDIEKDVSKIPNYYVTILNDTYAILYTPITEPYSMYSKKIPSIVFVEEFTVYTLQNISPIISSNINIIQSYDTLGLTGKDVTVAILDTGIDYLIKEFCDKDGNTRITYLWDQTISSGRSSTEYFDVPFGSVYESTEINSAISEFKNGNNPYSIVPSRDNIGHGTNSASIIGANSDNIEILGAAPDCNFFIIKLIEDAATKKVYDVTIPVYNITYIFASILVLVEYALKSNTPLVIYIPLGTNSGNHKGNGLLEEFIDEISTNKGIVLVTGAGNEGDAEGHVSGFLTKSGGYKDIQLYVAPDQVFLSIEFWINKPNIFSLNVISPSGEDTGIIPVSLNFIEDFRFVFEKTYLRVVYKIPEGSSGDQLIWIHLDKLQPGTWKFRLVPEYTLDGCYNGWLPQKGLTAEDTHFISANPYGTFTNPSSCKAVLTVANYNQGNNNIVNSSGMSFLDNLSDKIDIAAGGVNVNTLSPGAYPVVVNGTSVSAAIGAGACALLLQWGIVNGNNTELCAKEIKTYLKLGTTKRPGDIYPNAEWGYGILNLLGTFENLS